MSLSAKNQRQFIPHAAILAWLWPGLGHLTLGERKRGLLIMFGVLFLFLGGLLVGGVDSVDRKDYRLWFLAQALCGPVAFDADRANQTYVKPLPNDRVQRYERDDPELKTRLRRKGLGRVNEMGTLFCALAGLMNLVVILDALSPPAWRSEPQRRGAGAAAR